MLLEYVNKLDAESVLSDDIFIELFQIDDEIARQRKYYELESRAKALNCVTQFKKIYALYNKQYKRAHKAEIVPTENDFSIDYPDQGLSFQSGAWQADETGIYYVGQYGREYACHHPILPVEILKNAESGLCKTKIVFKVRNTWNEISVSRELISSASKIVALSQYGAQVTSENARNLVRFLSDIEAMNESVILEHTSTSRLGWINKDFMPYATNNIVFDNDPKLMSLFRSIHEQGNREKWYTLMKKVRSNGQIEVLIYAAASLASCLVEPCGALPFIVSLWGGTGLGKTVALMLVTSIWADPSEGAYMTDAKATTTAMEIRLDALNSLPMCIDDMAQIRAQEDDFSTIIYRWCAGKGRDRSNQNLGLNPLTTWRNCTLTNGERSMISDLMQGGAANRVIDIEISQSMFANGNATAKTLRQNFGFCGKEFVSVIQEMGFEELNNRFERWVDYLKKKATELGDEKEDKQINPMALILTADEISEEFLYKDGVRLDPIKCLSYLRGKNDVSENIRAYEYLTDTITENQMKFIPDDDENFKYGCWGKYMDEAREQVAIIPSILAKILKDGGFQKKSFISWAQREGIVDLSGERHLGKYISLGKERKRCIILDLHADFEGDPGKNWIECPDGFESVFE